MIISLIFTISAINRLHRPKCEFDWPFDPLTKGVAGVEMTRGEDRPHDCGNVVVALAK